MHLANDGYEVIVTSDCDLSHDARAIPVMLRLIADGADVVVGSRYVQGGGVRNWSLAQTCTHRVV